MLAFVTSLRHPRNSFDYYAGFGPQLERWIGSKGFGLTPSSSNPLAMAMSLLPSRSAIVNRLRNFMSSAGRS